MRPPRRPARARPLAAFRPVVVIVGAALLALLLLTATMRFVVRTSAGPPGPPWFVEVGNRSGTDFDGATLLAVPAARGAHPIAEKDLGALGRRALGGARFDALGRPCVLRLELAREGRVYVFDRVAPVGPGGSSPVRIDVGVGPTVNGAPPDEVRPR